MARNFARLLASLIGGIVAYVLLSFYDLSTLFPMKSWQREVVRPRLYAPLDEPVHTAADIRFAMVVRLTFFVLGVVIGYLFWPLISRGMQRSTHAISYWATHQPRRQTLGTIAGLVGGLVVSASVTFSVLEVLKGSAMRVASDPWLEATAYFLLALLLGFLGAVVGRRLARPRPKKE